MKKVLILCISSVLFFSSMLGQETVDEEKLAKAKKNGNVVFESVLKDADLVIYSVLFPARTATTTKRTWILKFENGAVIRRVEAKGGALDNLWWIGKKYVVYKGKGNYIQVQLIEEEKEKK